MMMTEGHIGQLAVEVLGMQAGGSEKFEDHLWEARRLTSEIEVMLDEVDGLA